MINLFFKVNLTNNHEPATSMLKRTATVLLALMTSATTWAVDNKAGILGDGEDIHAVAIDETNFPDFNFRENWVLKQAFAADNYLTDQEAASVTAIDVSSKSIADLTGIEYFTALISLNCSDNQLTALDLSKNTALEVLDCSNNYLNALDVSKNTALKELYCYCNWIRDEDMLALVNSLHQNGGTLCAYATTNDQNEMTTPRVADAKAKKWQVKAWDGSKYVDYAGIFAVYVNEKNFPDAAFRNYVSTLDANPTNGYLDEGEIDFTKRIEVSSMNITSLKGIEHFPALLYLKCDDNQLADLDVSKNTALIELDCSNNKLTAIDVSNNTALEQLDCSGNKISKGMQALVSSLPQNNGTLLVYNPVANDGNRITTEQVDAASEKGWLVAAGSGDDWMMYLGILLGDANGDEYVNVADIVAVVNHQKGKDVEGFSLPAADVNDDGKADGKDAELISKMIMEEREENQ